MMMAMAMLRWTMVALGDPGWAAMGRWEGGRWREEEEEEEEEGSAAVDQFEGWECTWDMVETEERVTHSLVGNAGREAQRRMVVTAGDKDDVICVDVYLPPRIYT